MRTTVEESQDLGPEIVRLADEIVSTVWSFGPDQKQVARLLILSVFVASRRGSTRLPLGGGVNGALGHVLADTIAATGDDITVGAALRECQRLIRGNALDDIFGRPGDYRPLIVDGDHLYLHRFHQTEADVARALKSRLQRTADLGDVDGALAKIGQFAALSEEQRQAVRLAASRSLSVITGGPGTGKTTVIQSIVATLEHLGILQKEILLGAPTGKAAQRMSVATAAPAQTLHRLLGYGADTFRFRHHENNPLRCRALIIDEASMIDLWLMRSVLRAMPEDALLILLGDSDQLPSVDAGAVMRDLCELEPAPFVARLTKNYRTSDTGAAHAILAGDSEALSATECVVAGALDPFIRAWAARLRNPSANLEQRFCVHEQRKILCAMRRGPRGTEAINRAVARALDVPRPFAPGFPVIVRKNDYARNLWNGDQGVVVTDPATGELCVAFRDGGGFRTLPLHPLEHMIDPGFALTVHQSQGSEFDEVALILPERDTTLLTRELLYTAITRARRMATIHGSATIIRSAVRRQNQRFSGLKDQLSAD
jgi:exodeoxyribonuclease V alpha subunit